MLDRLFFVTDRFPVDETPEIRRLPFSSTDDDGFVTRAPLLLDFTAYSVPWTLCIYIYVYVFR